MTVEVSHGGRVIEGVTVDVSPLGFYLTVPARALPPAGTLVQVKPVSLPVTITGRVRRVVQPGSTVGNVPGVAVEFESIRTIDSPDMLAGFLVELGAPDSVIDAFELGEEGVIYRPAPSIATIQRVVELERLAPERALPDNVGRGRQLHWGGADRRRHIRIPTHVDTRWYMAELPHFGRVLNVGQAGCFVHTDHALPPIGTRLRVDLPILDAPAGVIVHLHGQIARHWEPAVEGLPGFGVVIKSIDERRRLGVFRLWLRRQALRQRPLGD